MAAKRFLLIILALIAIQVRDRELLSARGFISIVLTVNLVVPTKFTNARPHTNTYYAQCRLDTHIISPCELSLTFVSLVCIDVITHNILRL